MSNLDLPEGTKLFINEVLCPYYIRVFGSFAKNCGTGNQYIPILLLMVF